MSTARNYTAKDIEMVIASSVIVQNAISNSEFLQTRRSTWTLEFFQELQSKIDQTTQTYLGLDSAKQLRDASRQVFAIRDKSLMLLSEFKVQLEQDFKNNPVRRSELLTNLGFTTNFAAANNHKDQEALIELLFQFKTNMTNAAKTEISEKGIPESTIDQIIVCANILKDSDVIQEFHKGNRQILTQDAIIAFNEIYDDVISICIISRNLFKGQRTKQDLFSFKKITESINGN